MKKIQNLFTALCFCMLVLSNYAWSQNKQAALDIPMNNETNLIIDGPHRFVKIAGITGLHVSSLKTKAFVETTALQSGRGTISVWMSPLENIDKAPAYGLNAIFPLLSDYYPPSKVDSCRFSVYYWGSGYPRVIARFTDGGFWQQMDYGLASFVYAESLPLQKGEWYHVAVTWDKPKETIAMYINGELVGHNYSAKSFKLAKNKIHIGNPLMVLSGLKVQTESLSKDEVRKEYLYGRPQTNQFSDQTIRQIVNPQDKPAITSRLDGSWKKVYECNFTKKSDLDSWTFQTGEKFRDKFKLDITENGLYWETPEMIDTESRGYLWCPAKVEGDQWIEFEFQLVSPKGLALLMMCASGMQGEDIIEDQGLRKTGSMGDMNANYRNYHWEYVRRVEAMRTDVETQYVCKNPWGKGLYVGCVPRLERNRWIKIRYIKVGNKICGSFDGKTVFEVEDSAYNNNGPLLNSGRVVLRQMYNTAMRYRNFVIYSKKSN
ncbi:MAG: DUF1961 family protein [Prolixibacteraceae bacterium]|jgi:hypothetical protein|nr:DUF1961 family protein [Prolixibacteraceae bacterium]